MGEAGLATSLTQGIDEALRRRDMPTAIRLLTEAEQARPSDPEIKMQKAVALRVAGDFEGALAALDGALALDPYNFVALLAKGAVLERLAGEHQASLVYKNALKILPAVVPPALQAPVARAREVVAKTAGALEAWLTEKLAETGASCAGPARARLEESVRIFSGAGRIYNSEPVDLHYPRLPAIPFPDRSEFPWLADLEAKTETIRGELEPLLTARDGFDPYIQYPADAPVNQWAELNHSEKWTSYFLWKDGEKQAQAARQCPKTVGFLETLPLCDQPGFAPNAVFSALEAKTHIPPHTGSTNTRLLVHLPLILPGPARFRVGGETRDWQMGEAWVFDDTIEHEAWNDAESLRVILILDIWNPALEPAERELVCAMLSAREQFFAR